MARKSKRQADVGINMTPMIDVVFQLITFFMLASSYASAEIDKMVKVPVFPDKESQAQMEQPKFPFRVVINMAANREDGNDLNYMKIGSQPIGTDFDRVRDTLAMLLERMRQKDPQGKLVVILRAHRTLHTVHPAKVMSIAGGLGITDVQFATPLGEKGARLLAEKGGN